VVAECTHSLSRYHSNMFPSPNSSLIVHFHMQARDTFRRSTSPHVKRNDKKMQSKPRLCTFSTFRQMTANDCSCMSGVRKDAANAEVGKKLSGFANRQTA
jgi:hypothetical protein